MLQKKASIDMTRKSSLKLNLVPDVLIIHYYSRLNQKPFSNAAMEGCLI